MVAQPEDTPQDSRARRRDRYSAQRTLWKLSTLKRVRGCGRVLSHGSDGVQVRVTSTATGRRAGYAGLQTCGSVWACPSCASKILNERQGEIAAAVGNWRAGGGSVAFMTFTVRHNSRQSLQEVWTGVSSAWAGVTSGRRWQDVKAVYGARPGDDGNAVLPWVRVTEVTHGDNGWHVHVHALLFLDGDVTEPEMQGLYDDMWGGWAAGARAAGLDAEQVNVARFLEAGENLADYFTKNRYDRSRVSMEIARADLKVGRFGNRSVVQLLRDVVRDRVPADVALWAEFEAGSKGRRQMTWGRGSRDLLGLGDAREDDEIAGEEVGTAEDAVIEIPKDAWKSLLAVPGRKADLLEVAEDHGAGAAGLLLDAWGLEWVKART